MKPIKRLSQYSKGFRHWPFSSLDMAAASCTGITISHFTLRKSKTESWGKLTVATRKQYQSDEWISEADLSNEIVYQKQADAGPRDKARRRRSVAEKLLARSSRHRLGTATRLWNLPVKLSLGKQSRTCHFACLPNDSHHT